MVGFANPSQATVAEERSGSGETTLSLGEMFFSWEVSAQDTASASAVEVRNTKRDHRVGSKVSNNLAVDYFHSRETFSFPNATPAFIWDPKLGIAPPRDQPAKPAGEKPTDPTTDAAA